MVLLVLVKLSINTNAFDDHLQAYLTQTIDFLLENAQISSTLCDHFYSNLSLKLDQLRRSSLSSTDSLQLSIDYYQLQIYDVLREKNYSSARVHLLQILFQFKLILLQSSELQLSCASDDRDSALLVYANLAYTTMPRDHPPSEKDLLRVKESIGYSLNDAGLPLHAGQCDQIYPLNKTLANIVLLQEQCLYNGLFASELKKLARLLNNLCSKVC